MMSISLDVLDFRGKVFEVAHSESLIGGSSPVRWTFFHEVGGYPRYLVEEDHGVGEALLFNEIDQLPFDTEFLHHVNQGINTYFKIDEDVYNWDLSTKEAPVLDFNTGSQYKLWKFKRQHTVDGLEETQFLYVLQNTGDGLFRLYLGQAIPVSTVHLTGV
jgi:hypothetical protein